MCVTSYVLSFFPEAPKKGEMSDKQWKSERHLWK